MKKLLICFLSILSLITMSGCWDSVEYENLAMISAIGIDYNVETDEFTVSLQKMISKKEANGDGEGSKPSAGGTGVVHAIKNKTIYGAISESQTVITNKLFFGCAKALIIGEDAAKYKLMDIVDLMDRTPTLREEINIVIVQNAEETLCTDDSANPSPSGIEISGLIKQSINTGTARPVSAMDFQEMLAIGGLEAVAPRIKTSSNEKPEVKGGTEENIRSSEERIGNELISGLAVFKGAHFVGYMDEKESLGYLLITGVKLSKLKTAASSDNADDFAYYYIKKSSSSMSVKLEDSLPVVYLKVSITAELRKNTNNCEEEILLPEKMEKMESELEDSMRSDIEASLVKCQKEYNSDVYGFGFKLFREDPKLWREKYEGEWDSLFPNIPVKTEVNVRLVGTGTNMRKFIVR